MTQHFPIKLEELVADPYRALGVKRFINATCHHTMFGGTLIPEPALNAMRAAADSPVDMMDLHRAAGRVISQYTHAEDGFIVSGCAAAMMVGAAAVLTGSDQALFEQLPDSTGLQHMCVAKRFPRRVSPEGKKYVDHSYAIAVQTSGMRFIEVGQGDTVTKEEFEAGFNDEVAMVYWIGYAPAGDIAMQDVIDIAHSHGVPVMVDASNSLPPRENLYRFIDMGADLVCFSGGKGLQGPQGAGILAGRADLVDAARRQSAPNHGIGRICKVSKEEVVGQVASLIWWAEQDEEELMTEHHRRSGMMAGMLKGIGDATVEIVFPDYNQRPYPTVHLTVSPESDLTGAKLRQLLHDGDPAIATMTHYSDPNTIRIDVRLLGDNEIVAIGKRVKEIFEVATR